MKELAAEYRGKLLEAVAEQDDELMMKYLDGEELTEQEIHTALRKGTIANEIVPVCCGSSYKNKRSSRVIRCNSCIHAITIRYRTYQRCRQRWKRNRKRKHLIQNHLQH